MIETLSVSDSFYTPVSSVFADARNNITSDACFVI